MRKIEQIFTSSLIVHLAFTSHPVALECFVPLEAATTNGVRVVCADMNIKVNFIAGTVRSRIISQYVLLFYGCLLGKLKKKEKKKDVFVRLEDPTH